MIREGADWGTNFGGDRIAPPSGAFALQLLAGHLQGLATFFIPH